jgi:hypothetical protein
MRGLSRGSTARCGGGGALSNAGRPDPSPRLHPRERTEGVGERPGLQVRERILTVTAGCGDDPPTPSSSAVHEHEPLKLEALSRRRPLSSTRAGGVEGDRDALTAPRLAPARLTQSSTSYEVEDWESSACLLLLPALGLLRALFRRCFRLRLSLLRHAALLA